MSWLNNPRFIPVRDRIVEALKRNEYRFRRTPNVLFLCGGFKSQRRERLAEYIRKKRTDTLVFYAETVWSAISSEAHLSALEMEAQLAALSDIVIVIVESPGTFAEAGAFSLSPDLRRKLLLILDSKYRTGQSFIETGPVRWTDNDSDFRPSLWVSHDRILECASELEDRLNKVLPKPAKIEGLLNSPKHLVFFICDLVAVFGPCPMADITLYIERILGSRVNSVGMLLGLARAMRLLKSARSDAGVDLYYRPLEDGKLPVFHYTKEHLGIPTLRAKALSVMQTIEEARTALEHVKEG